MTDRHASKVRPIARSMCAACASTARPFESRFELIDTGERTLRLASSRPREGQGSFRTRLLDAYGRRCAITGEHTEIVLEAAHIQPYLGRRLREEWDNGHRYYPFDGHGMTVPSNGAPPSR